MFGMINILVTNEFVICCDTFILISDTMKYDNVHVHTKQSSKKVEYSDILKNQRIQRVHLAHWTNEKDTTKCIVSVAFYAESDSMLFCLVDIDL